MKTYNQAETLVVIAMGIMVILAMGIDFLLSR